MHFIISIIISVLATTAHAQTIDKVSDDTATVVLPGVETLSVGDKVSFLDEQLNISGQGEVTQVQTGGRTATIKVVSGLAKPGMSLEKARTPAPSKMNSEDVELAPPGKNVSSIALDEDDRRILRIGEISPTRHIVGGIIGLWPIGFGTGHAVQGRFMDKGWIFALGEAASLGLAMAATGECTDSIEKNRKSCSGDNIAMGVLGYIGFRVWEIYDVWVGPTEINRRHRELTTRMKPTAEFRPVLAPTQDGLMAGLQVRF